MIFDTEILPTGGMTGPRTCDRCKINATSRFWCASCSHEYLNATYAPGNPFRRMEASKSRLADFPDVCPTHGLTLFNTRTGLCRPCSSARAVSRQQGLAQYQDVCEVHGPSSFAVNTGKCLACFTATGGTRASENVNFRATARRDGHTQYQDVCEVHGPTPFSVNTGRCLTCYTATGSNRTNRAAAPRAVARRAGETAYLDVCEVHGPTPFSVQSGRCLTCYTTGGIARSNEPGWSGASSRRAEARRKGETQFLGTCGAHGETPFSVSTGRCLTCYTAAGVPRKTPTPDLRERGKAWLELGGFTPDEIARLLK